MSMTLYQRFLNVYSLRPPMNFMPPSTEINSNKTDQKKFI
jgi:hypothetical protein